MIIECNVLSYNPHSNILAFVYENKNIQITIGEKLDKDIKKVNIKYENGGYCVVSEKEDKEVKSKFKKIFVENTINNEDNYKKHCSNDRYLSE